MAKFWGCIKTWRQSSYNTFWCLLGCSIGDFGTIAYFQIYAIQWPTLYIMILAIINGIITSIILETIVLIRHGLIASNALKTALGMSLLSMVAMEIAMNTVDWAITGGARLNWLVIAPMLIAGFITPLPYNYWRLKKFGKSCH